MSILNHDLLILQQFRSDSSPRFDILDAQGQGVGVVSGTESSVRRIFLGAREFDVLDADGSLLAHVSDVRDLWRDTYKVMRGDGSVLATIARKMGFFSRKFSITLTSGEELAVKGDVIDREFTVVNANSEEAVAQVSRERTGVIEAFFGRDHDRYALHYPDSTSPDLRLAILGSMIALDLMRAKDARKGTHSATSNT
jgi:hypothetical protein